MVGCLDSEHRLAQSQTEGMRLFSRRLGEAAARGGEYGSYTDFAFYTLHLPYNWGKSRKTSVRVTERRPADQRRMDSSRRLGHRGRWPRLACWPCRPCLALQATGKPSVSVNICQVAVLGGSPLQLTLSQSKQLGL